MIPAARRLALALLVVLAALAGPLAAQTDPDAGAPRLTAPGVHGGDMTMVTAAQTMAQEFRVRLAERLAALPDTLSATAATLARNSPTGRADYFLWLVPWTLSFLTLGNLLVWLVLGLPLVRPWLRALRVPAPAGIAEKLPMLALQALAALVLLALGMVAGFMLGAASFDAPENPQAEKTVVIIFGAWAATGALVILWRLILAPRLPAYRLPALGDAEARRLHGWLVAGSVLAVGVHAYCTWMSELGLDENVHAISVAALTLLPVGVSLATVLANRGAITRAILGGLPRRAASGPQQLLAALWVPAVVLYAVVTWAEMTWRLVMGAALGVPPILGLQLVVGTMVAAHAGALFLIARLFRPRRPVPALPAGAAERAAAEPGAESRAGADAASGAPDGAAAAAVPPPGRIVTYEDLAIRVATMLAALSGAWVLVQLWVARIPLLGRLLDSLGDVLVVLLLAYVAYQAARIAIDRRIEAEGGAEVASEPGDEGGARGASRLATLLPLLRSALLILIVAVAGAMVALEFGINLAPLVAGAGVVGLAVGFGAQYLIRDVFSGIFFLIDDAFRRGEYIDVGNVKGTVEKISIRSFQLRHHLGPLHTIPFGEIKSLTNYSRDWVIMKLPLRVTYDTDVEKVRKLVKQLGQDLLKDPVIGDQFLQPLKSQGVIEMQDSAMIIRVKFMTKPGDQWAVRQRVYREIRELFQREGIKFAHREVTVRVAEAPGAPPLTQAQREAAAAAALDLDAMPDDLAGTPPAARAAGG